MRIVLRMVGRGDLDPGELFAGGAVFVHVAHGTGGLLGSRHGAATLIMERE